MTGLTIVAGAAAATVINTKVVWLLDPLWPVIVIGKVPKGVADVVLIVRLDDPAPATLDGLNAAVALVGSPEALKPTLPLNPALVLTRIEYPAAPVGATLCEVCADVRAKSAAAAMANQTVCVR